MARGSAQLRVLRTLLSLPAPLLRLMSGGGVVYQGGRTLDPRFQFLAAQARRAPAMTAFTATFSTVNSHASRVCVGRIRPTTSARAWLVAASIASTRSSVGSTIGR